MVNNEIDGLTYDDCVDTYDDSAGVYNSPTCLLDLTYVETYRNVKLRIYKCSECGRTCEEIYGKHDRCPHCGAVVVDEN